MWNTSKTVTLCTEQVYACSVFFIARKPFVQREYSFLFNSLP